MISAKSAAELMASAPKKYESHHYAMTGNDYSATLAMGRRFFSVENAPLATPSEVKAALRKDGEVISR